MSADLAGAWRDLVTAALLGTDRAGEQPVALPDAVVAVTDAAGLRVDDGSPASLLAAAALLDVARSAGRRYDLTRAEPLDPAPDETQPAARTSPATAARLLAGPREDLDEWLELLRARGLLVPPAALPELLRLAATDGPVRAAAEAVVGARGVWLARLDPELAPVLAGWSATLREGSPDLTGDAATSETWRLGDLATRVRWLTEQRRRDPAAAREALAAVLPGLPAGERAQLVAVLATGLGPDDGAVLERALDDRAAGVRRAAAALLTKLPGSAFQDRARQRAAGCLRVGRVGLRRQLLVTLPEETLDAAAVRDGVADLHGSSGAASGGPRAQLLYRLLAAAPLDTWVPALAPAPQDLVRLPVADDRAELVHRAWAEAAVREHDPRWAEALAPLLPSPAALVRLLPPPARLHAVDAMLRRRGDERHSQVVTLREWPRPWPPELVDIVVAAVRRSPAASYGDRSWCHELAQLLGRRADPLRTVVDPGENAYLQHVVDQLAERRRTYEETTA